MTNPYQPPAVEINPFEAISKQHTAPPVEKLRQIARQQRLVMLTLLVNIVANIVFNAVGTSGQVIGYVSIALSIAAIVMAIYAAYRLARLLTNSSTAVLYAILMLVPFVSIIALLVLNQKAISLFKRYRIQVGFLGADPNSIH